MEILRDIADLTHHRSRARVRDLGEVFTPKKYVQQMLDMLDKSIWADTNVVFFEPTCGHGNFVSAIVERRLKAFRQKAKRQKIKKPHYYAVANALNKLWAIDIDPQNIELCRQRVFDIVFRFLCQYEQNLSVVGAITSKTRSPAPSNLTSRSFKKITEFLAHVLSCLEWQIQENEALSCLQADPVEAKKSADKTLVSRKWFKEKGHRPINFKNTWCRYFKSCGSVVPIEYLKNLRVVRKLLKQEKKVLQLNLVEKMRWVKHVGKLSQPKDFHPSDLEIQAVD